MTSGKALSLLLVIPLLAASASAQKSDWRALQYLPAGTRLKIKLKHGHTFGHCEFLGATDDALICDYGGPMRYQPQYPRDNIKAVYRTHDARVIGFAIGAATGIILGATKTDGPAAGRELFAVIDGCILGGLGYFSGLILDPFFHGQEIYVAPRDTGGAAGAPMPTVFDLRWPTADLGIPASALHPSFFVPAPANSIQ